MKLLVSISLGIRDSGRVREELSHITDIPATVLDVAGVAYPEQFDQRRITPLVGRSLLPVLRGESREGHAVLCWSTSRSRAVREGHWKLVAGPNGPWQLYDLSRDRIESHDLAPANPERAARLRAMFETWKDLPTRSGIDAR